MTIRKIPHGEDTTARSALDFESGKEGGEFPKLLLFPGSEGVIVALGALQFDA
jgi:hypothetical protein